MAPAFRSDSRLAHASRLALAVAAIVWFVGGPAVQHHDVQLVDVALPDLFGGLF